MSALPYLDSAVLERFKSLLLATRSPMVGAFSGIHRSLLKGGAMEFSELREYAPGDDLRRLDWNAYARSDRFFLKEFEAETNARVYFLLDTSGSMNFKGREGQEDRLTFAKRLCATLSALFLNQSDAVGVSYEEEGSRVIPLHRGDDGIAEVIAELHSISAGGDTTLATSLHDLAEGIPRRSLVIVLSDFFTDLPPLKKALQHLQYYSHEVSFLQLLTEEEKELKAVGRTAFRDMESGAVIQSNPETVKQHYLEQFSRHEGALSRLCHETGTHFSQALLGDGVEKAVLDLLSSHEA